MKASFWDRNQYKLAPGRSWRRLGAKKKLWKIPKALRENFLAIQQVFLLGLTRPRGRPSGMRKPRKSFPCG